MNRGFDEIYVAAFLARCKIMRGANQRNVDEPGVYGLFPLTGDALIRLLVTDDRAYDVLAALLPEARAGMISIFAAATRSAALVDRQPAWRSDTVTAMVCSDLRAVPTLSLPNGLSLRPVRRLPDDPGDGVPLEGAVAAASAASPAIGQPPEPFADFLRSLPAAIRLFAAVMLTA